MLRLEVSVLVVEVDDEGLADVYITVQMPPEGDPSAVEGWPGNQLLPVLADASRVPFASMNYPTHVPNGPDSGGVPSSVQKRHGRRLLKTFRVNKEYARVNEEANCY